MAHVACACSVYLVDATVSFLCRIYRDLGGVDYFGDGVGGIGIAGWMRVRGRDPQQLRPGPESWKLGSAGRAMTSFDGPVTATHTNQRNGAPSRATAATTSISLTRQPGSHLTLD